MNRILQELPQHSGSDAHFPHALWPAKFPLSAIVLHSFYRSMTLPDLPSVNMQHEPENERSLPLRFRRKWHCFPRRQDKSGHTPSCAITPRLGQKARLQEIQVQVLSSTWTHHGLSMLFQTIVLGRICLPLSEKRGEEKRKRLPTISSTCIFLWGERAENMCISFTWHSRPPIWIRESEAVIIS